MCHLTKNVFSFQLVGFLLLCNECKIQEKKMKTRITIIGAGVVGLAIAAKLAEIYNDIFLLEESNSFGHGASSRNSEVIHASIYYPWESLKGKLCLRGNELMYEICKNNSIPFANCRKFIVATNEQEIAQLETVLETAKGNGVRGVRIVDRNEIKKMESGVYAEAAVYSPSSGIVDSHRLMEYFERKSNENNVSIVYNHKITGIERKNGEYELIVTDSIGESFKLTTDIIINSAGLSSGYVAEFAGIDIDKYDYRICYHKGIYFRVNRQLEKYPQALIYPVPLKSGHVGIHTTPDLYGGMRLGPHFFRVDEVDYSVDETFHEMFYEFSKRFLPFLEYDDISPDMAGIMATVQKENEAMKDFIIREENDKGLPNMINLIGIDSPGLTAAPAIAEYINNIVTEINE
jgi:L-2-hydroxyglutarate oxidase LhgO